MTLPGMSRRAQVVVVENTWDDAQVGERLRVELSMRVGEVLIASVLPAADAAGCGKPAVFSFRPGDPQYSTWRRRWQEAIDSLLPAGL